MARGARRTTLPLDSVVMGLGMSTWSQTSVFDELSQLTEMQADKLQHVTGKSEIQKAPARR